MIKKMVKELILSYLEVSMLGNGKMGEKMVKEYGLQLMEKSIPGIGKME